MPKKSLPASYVAGPGVKFSLAMVADGKVFVGTQTQLDIHGLSC